LKRYEQFPLVHAESIIPAKGEAVKGQPGKILGAERSGNVDLFCGAFGASIGGKLLPVLYVQLRTVDQPPSRLNQLKKTYLIQAILSYLRFTGATFLFALQNERL